MNASSDPRFVVRDGAVHVWRAGLGSADDARNLETLLSTDEVIRADRFRFPEHRRRFVIARGCLRQLLGAYMGIAPRDVAFTYSEASKPALAEKHQSGLRFNVSHSGDIAAFAFVTNRDIGVDVELIRHDVDVEQIPQRFFSSAEQESLNRLQGEEKFTGFFNCWTRKEAYVKAVGSGLSLPLRDFDVSLLPGEPAKLLATRPDAAVAERWSMASLDFGEGCAAAVVVEGPIHELLTRHFTPSHANL